MKQGCLQSPLLFNLVMNDLLDIIEGSGIWIVEVKDDKIGGMAFADNLVLLCNRLITNATTASEWKEVCKP